MVTFWVVIRFVFLGTLVKDTPVFSITHLCLKVDRMS
jgi:hypothetical protein